MDQHVLIRVRDLVFYGLLIVCAPTVGAATLLAVGFDVVEAKLANLNRQNIYQETVMKRHEGTRVMRDNFRHT